MNHLNAEIDASLVSNRDLVMKGTLCSPTLLLLLLVSGTEPKFSDQLVIGCIL